MSFPADVQTLLERGVDVMLGTDLFMTLKGKLPSNLPTTPFLTVVITGGSGPDFVQNKRHPSARHPSAQITAHAISPQDASDMAANAYNALVIWNTRVNGTHYRSIRPLQEPFELASDDRNLARCVFNILADVRS